MNITKKIALIATIALCGQQAINASWLDAGKSLATSVFNTAVKPVCKTAVQTVAKQNKVVIGLGALTAACAISSVKNWVQANNKLKKIPKFNDNGRPIDVLVKAAFYDWIYRPSRVEVEAHAINFVNYAGWAIILGTCTAASAALSYALL